MSGCDLECSSCNSSGCSSTQQQESMLEKPHQSSNIRKVIAVLSGKGGVGKSLVTSLLAVELKRRGKNVAILDSDITGPSIPKAFGLKKGDAIGTQLGILPAKTSSGIDVMSINLLLENEKDPVLWRGPIIANAVKQFWTDVIYDDVDYMLVDMPPGTGDVALTVFQSLPVDGIIIVTSPQDLVSMIVEKAYKMATLMKIPVIGMVENFSYFHCPDNGIDYKIFGESDIDLIALKKGILAVSKIPINPIFAKKVDEGLIEQADTSALNKVVERILRV